MALSKARRIQIMLGIDIAFFVLELGVGSWVGSLALMADAFHMVREVLKGQEY
jgi:solute carrier family 30 (zinc transporter), member 1